MEKKNTKEPVQTKKNTNKNLFIILGAIVILLVIIILVVYFINNSKDKEETTTPTEEQEQAITNTNEGVIGDQEVEGLTLTKTSLVYKDGISTLETTVTNSTDEPYYLEEFHIIVKDEEGNDIINYTDEEGNTINYLIGYAGVEIPSQGSTKIETSIDFDISSSAYEISYEIVK